jgi:outer membrane protein OmpA-like peptidoglycan-associated protein
MKKFIHRSKVGVTLATLLLTVASVSPAIAANTVSDIDPSTGIERVAPGTNIFDSNSSGNTGFGSNLNLVYSNTNTFGVAGKPSDYNFLTNSNNNVIRSVGLATGTADNKNILNFSDLNTIDGRSNLLTNTDSNTIVGNANTITGNSPISRSKSNTITGDSNTLTDISNSNTITGNNNVFIKSNSNTITGNTNVLTDTTSSTITGNNAHVTNGNFVAVVGDGAVVNGNNTSALGANSSVSASDSSALGANSSVSATNSVALGANSIADRPNTVSVGAPGDQRQITNVANGTASNDAVNVGQWMAGNSITEGKIYRTGALAAALTGIMPLPYDPNSRTQVGMGVGGYHGENAVAIGINHYINESLLVNAGMSADGSERMWRGGLTWRLGHTTKRGELTVGNAEVDNLKSQLQQQQSDMQQLKEQVAALTSVAGQTSVVGQSPVHKIFIEDVLFAFDKDTLKQEAYPILDNVVAEAKKNPSWTYTLIGNTDSKGSKAYNMDLALRRATTVQNYLISQGVPANCLRIAEEGELQPKDTNATADGRAENRRVEIHVN